jgi:hypothetical protein
MATTMKTQELPLDTQLALDELIELLARALDAAANDVPHLTAISKSSMPHGAGSGILVGGSVSSPAPPLFNLDRRNEIKKLHSNLLSSGEGILHGVILSAARDNVGSPWAITPKLVSRAEYSALLDKRQPIDRRIRELLDEHAGDQKLVFIAYGQPKAGQPARLRKSATGQLITLDADPRLEALFNEARELYRAAGLEPIILNWTRADDHQLNVEDSYT